MGITKIDVSLRRLRALYVRFINNTKNSKNNNTNNSNTITTIILITIITTIIIILTIIIQLLRGHPLEEGWLLRRWGELSVQQWFHLRVNHLKLSVKNLTIT